MKRMIPVFFFFCITGAACIFNPENKNGNSSDSSNRPIAVPMKKDTSKRPDRPSLQPVDNEKMKKSDTGTKVNKRTNKPPTLDTIAVH